MVQSKQQIYTPPKHFVSAATIVINDEKEILLIKGPIRGWEMPGGIVEEGESLKDAAVRETKEESGIDIEVLKFCGIFQNVNKSICNTLFLAKPIGGDLTTSSESLEVGFYPIEKALEMVTVGNFKQRIEYCLDNSKHPFYIEF
ncbi:NUDIX domain-containing protein [Bacillus sp. ISL-35]|uniref:NUDIX hydrolase n=1 Tax=Bacillus sp. ISL-35 TaxID=2819122 RepID=UPI001BE9A482|nr:NUDIX domain-containing protein [Bacillus sp. ISL-35]MBT2680912.1 NUDIX domain-containing protein [Bacillus sp. ISL-35]MBT2705228.1 NUDIX domain-containing protein [Chryseobacterium sp. ISL-80]